MKNKRSLTIAALSVSVLWCVKSARADSGAPATTSATTTAVIAPQLWNFHIQNTETLQGAPAFSAKYSGPNSLRNNGEVEETVSVDLYAGLRLWSGAEAHVDGLLWQGFGLTNTVGIEDFPNGEAFKAGTHTPAFSFARLFVRQTIGFGGDSEDVSDDLLTLWGKRDISRLTITAGRFSATDIFDTNSYAGDSRRQFMNWALISNNSWDFPADSIGYTTGIALELNQPRWTLRYGFFQMPSVANSWTAEDKVLTYPHVAPASDAEFFKSWGMATELERRYSIATHPGAVRLLGWLNEADMGSYGTAILTTPANIVATRAYRLKYGFGLNVEQEITSDLGLFARLGWNDGHSEGWAATDVNYVISGGISLKGTSWQRPNDTIGVAGNGSGISSHNKHFLEDGGTGILDGDGRLNYGWEGIAEAYYDFDIWQTIHLTLDYQFINNPAFNRDRGPLSVIGARLHWQF